MRRASFFISKGANQMKEKNINYLLSLHIIRDLKSRNLINEDEFHALDAENKKAFGAYK
jgi:hypothetical protein